MGWGFTTASMEVKRWELLLFRDTETQSFTEN
jgi:hypothetical protein